MLDTNFDLSFTYLTKLYKHNCQVDFIAYTVII